MFLWMWPPRDKKTFPFPPFTLTLAQKTQHMLILLNVQWVWRHPQKWVVMPSRGAVLPNPKRRYAEGEVSSQPPLFFHNLYILILFFPLSSNPPPLSPLFISAMVKRWVVWPSSLLSPDILTPQVSRSEGPGSFTQLIRSYTPFHLTNMLETNLQQAGPASWSMRHSDSLARGLEGIYSVIALPMFYLILFSAIGQQCPVDCSGSACS